MSKPIYIDNVVIHEAPTPGMPVEYVLHLSDGNRTDVQVGTRDSQEAIVQAIANALVDANRKIYWHPITPGLVNALIKFRRAVITKDQNSVHLLKDMDGTPNELTRHEWNNFTKLRFHGLAVRDEKAGAGYWLLTRRGNDFLHGKLAIPAKVMTIDNKVEGHDDIVRTIDEVMGHDGPYFDTIETIKVQRFFPEYSQVGLGI